MAAALPASAMASASLAGPPDPAPAASSAKRRKKTGSAGAANDCFACQKRRVACDRVRPYCGQCIGLGRNCSGYKTVLTWGVGVASRGKLRGKSLPVQKAADEASPAPAPAPAKPKVKQEPKSPGKRRQSGAESPPKRARRPPEQDPLIDPSLSNVNPGAAAPAEPVYDYSLPEYSEGFPAFQDYSVFHHNQVTPPPTGSSASLSPGFPPEWQHLYHEPAFFDPFAGNKLLLDTPQYTPQYTPQEPEHDFDSSYPNDWDGGGTGLTSIPRSSLDVRYIGLPRRMQSLMHYYDTYICPVLVAFDGPHNPYRTYVIQLATHSEGLQSAIAALVTNNMRMREAANRWIMARNPHDPAGSAAAIGTLVGEPSAEEQHYKIKSIEHLNRQLASGDAAVSSDDSVLASLLTLCLFHVCNSGFSKFKTQLAGVQQLLRMRQGPNRSPFAGWVEMFFAWLDTMTSAVNDREAEIRGESLDLTDFSANLGALEQYSGCEGRLFKLISRLGRLNLLSQSRPVKDEPLPQQAHGGDFYHVPFPDTGAAPGHPTEFLLEWRDIRARLLDWQYQQPLVTVYDKNLADLSEAFRWAALLYVERLGRPDLPPAHPLLQEPVGKAMAHIERIGTASCITKFMLWPLFVAGTEACAPQHRALIRDRCVEIQVESGFYNNLSGLAVLERIWADMDGAGAGEGARRGSSSSVGSHQPFRWRAAMTRLDGEYIVI